MPALGKPPREAPESGIFHPPLSDRYPIPVSYKGFTITPRTFQIRGSGRWTLDLSICGPKGLRVFSGPLTYPTEQAAITGCSDLARRIIDGRSEEGSVEDLV